MKVINKIKSNKGSTLVTAILIMIFVATIGIITSLLLGANVRITLRRVTDRMEIVEAENVMYDVLNTCRQKDSETLKNVANESFENGYTYSVSCDENSIYTIELVKEERKVIAKVKFSDDSSYEIVGWDI